MGSKATKRPWNVQDVTNNSEARTTCYSVSSEFVSSKIDIEVVDVAVNDKQEPQEGEQEVWQGIGG